MFLTPLRFRKEDTSELTAKTKGSDRISPKMGLSLPLFYMKSTPNGVVVFPPLRVVFPPLRVMSPPLRVVFRQNFCQKEGFYP